MGDDGPRAATPSDSAPVQPPDDASPDRRRQSRYIDITGSFTGESFRDHNPIHTASAERESSAREPLSPIPRPVKRALDEVEPPVQEGADDLETRRALTEAAFQQMGREPLSALEQSKVRVSEVIGSWLSAPTNPQVDSNQREPHRMDEDQAGGPPFVPPDPENQVRVLPTPEKMAQKFPCENCNRVFNNKSELRFDHSIPLYGCF